MSFSSRKSSLCFCSTSNQAFWRSSTNKAAPSRMAGSCFCSSKMARPFWTVPMSVFKVTLIRPAEPHIPRPIDVIAAERNIISAPLRDGVQNAFRRRAHQCPRSHDPHFPAESESLLSNRSSDQRTMHSPMPATKMVTMKSNWSIVRNRPR